MKKYATATAFLITWLMILQAVPSRALAGTPSTEYAAKAAFLYQFTKFVDWPVDRMAPVPQHFTIGIIGRDPFKEEIAFLRGKQAKSRSVDVKYIQDVEEISECCMLFIGESESGQLERIIPLAEKYHVLTVSDTEGFADKGVMINLIESSQKIGFEINRDAVHRAHIKISSHLLKLARIVGPEPETP